MGVRMHGKFRGGYSYVVLGSIYGKALDSWYESRYEVLQLQSLCTSQSFCVFEVVTT